MSPKAKRIGGSDVITPAKKRKGACDDADGTQTPSTTSSTPSASCSGTPGDLRGPPANLLADENKPWIQVCLNNFAQIMDSGRTLVDWLHEKIDTLTVDGWLEMIDNAFPWVQGISYLKERDMETPGSKCVRLWQLGIHTDTGNAGIMINEETEALFQLVCVYGFKTDASNMVGVEKLASRVFDKAFVSAASWVRPYEPKKTLAPLFSVWHIKGWKRSIVALSVATMVAEVGLAGCMREVDPEVFATFQTVHVVLDVHHNSLQTILASRTLTMASTSTRRAPNCFNHLHQLRKMVMLGHNVASEPSDWAKRRGLMKAFNIGDREAAAALNLMSLPEEVITCFRRMVVKYGFHRERGPFSHASLACDALGLNKGPTLQNKVWQEDVKCDEYTLQLLAKRIEMDWEARYCPNTIDHIRKRVLQDASSHTHIHTLRTPGRTAGHAEIDEEAAEPDHDAAEDPSLWHLQQDQEDPENVDFRGSVRDRVAQS